MKQITLFKSFNKAIQDMDIMDVLKKIEQPDNIAFYDNLRDLYRQGKTEEFDIAKKTIKAFTVTGTFKNGRKPDLMTSYSGLLVLDFDKLGTALTDIRKVIEEDVHTFGCFLSPSGDGLKVIVETTTTSEEHTQIFNVVADYYGELTGMQVDRSGKDITRLCFMSYDPDVYINEPCMPFTLTQKPVSDIHKEAYRRSVELTNNKHVFEKGQRNEYVFLLASNCKRLGIPEGVASTLIMQDYNYDEKEVSPSIQSAYQNNPEEFAKFAGANVPQTSNTVSQVNLSDTPYIPDNVFGNLPGLLKEACSIFKDKRERDVFLTGAFSVLSTCFDNATGIYDQKEVYPNLYCFIVAPAASGKGALKYSKELGTQLHRKYLLEGAPLKMKVLFIPGNISSSAIIKLINDSDGNGIIFETEADTLNNTLKKEWGNIDDMLRKGFQHETISIARITNNQFDEIENPRLSMALSGTPEQVKGLIPSAENGLFSRVIFYAYKSPLVWKDVRPNPTTSYIDLFEKLSAKVVTDRDFLKANPTKFDLTKEQWDEHALIFGKLLIDLSQFISVDISGTVKRLGLILYRIAMILTILRKAESQTVEESIKCSDLDFAIAKELAMTYLEHAKIIFTTLPRSVTVDPAKRRFYDALPATEFERKRAVEIGKNVGVKERTVGNYLSDLVEGGKLVQPNYGTYKKA